MPSIAALKKNMNAAAEPNAHRQVLRYLLLAVLLAGIAWATMHRGEFDSARWSAGVQQAGAWGPLASWLAMPSPHTVLPGSVLTLPAVPCSPVLGTFYNLTGATLARHWRFCMARYLPRIGSRSAPADASSNS